MIAGWLERVAARLLHDHIHALFVAPAFADLQFEGTRGCLRAASYLGIVRAIVGALRFQATHDAQALLADDARLLALRYDAATIGGILCVQIVYHAGLALLFLDFQR